MPSFSDVEDEYYDEEEEDDFVLLEERRMEVLKTWEVSNPPNVT